jgi:hypothetical protein
VSARGTSNTNSRGSSYSRRARKAFLLVEFGDGYTAPCHYCLIELDWFTITADRILPGILGGRYIRSNIRPACGHCNSVDGNVLRERLKLERATSL